MQARPTRKKTGRSSGTGLRRVGRVHAPDGPQVGDRGGEQRDHDLRVERPAEEERRQVGRRGHLAAVGAARTGRRGAPRRGGRRARPTESRASGGRAGARRRRSRAHSRAFVGGPAVRCPAAAIRHMRISARGSGIMRALPSAASRRGACGEGCPLPGGARRQAAVEGGSMTFTRKRPQRRAAILCCCWPWPRSSWRAARTSTSARRSRPTRPSRRARRPGTSTTSSS